MYALKQIHEDLPDVIPVPEQLRHRRTEVIFIALDEVMPAEAADSLGEHPLLAFAGAFGRATEAELAEEDEGLRVRRQVAVRLRD